MSNLNFFRVMRASNFDAQSIPCNAGNVSFSGGKGYYVAQAVVLGEGIGPVTCSFNAQSVPDRFRLYWSGSTVADSLVVGDSLKTLSSYNSYTSSFSSVTSLTEYNYNYSKNEWTTGSAQSVSYNSASFPPQSADTGNFRRDNGDSNEVNLTLSSSVGHLQYGNWGAQKGVVPNFPVGSGQNYSQSCVDGNVLLSFYKHTKLPNSFDIIIEGPDSGTLWDLFSVSCPTGNTLHSSSVLDAGSERIVYHTAPTFDLRPGMTLYSDSLLTHPASASIETSHDGSFFVISGSLPTNPPTTGRTTGIYSCYNNPFLEGAENRIKISKGSSSSPGVIRAIDCFFP